MDSRAKITVSSGPDRGSTFPLDDELVHIGGDADNHVVLRDPTVEEYQASVVRRGGRYAIFTPLEGVVEVDGNVIPPECWVWLPASARIRLSDRTWVQFTGGSGGDAAPAAAGGAADDAGRNGGQNGEHNGGTARFIGTGGVEGAAVAVAAPKPSTADLPQPKPRGRRGDKAGRAKRPDMPAKKGTVARFITDRGGDTLVTLGEDGHLPELALVEGPERSRTEKKPRQTSPAVLYTMLAVSFVASLGLLLIETDPPGASSTDVARARLEIRDFYGTGEELRPYQRLLREARLARSRNDRTAERQAYRRVLDLLNSEDNNRLTGLTGSLERDERLRRLIAVLLSE
jgi:hypothetical protein